MITLRVFNDLKRDAGGRLLFHTVSSIVPSAALVLTIVFGMGTGVPPGRIATSKSSLLRCSRTLPTQQ